MLAPRARVLSRLTSNRGAAARVASHGGSVAVSGMSGRWPGGCEGGGALWSMLLSGGDAVGEVPAARWDVHGAHPALPEPLAVVTAGGLAGTAFWVALLPADALRGPWLRERDMRADNAAQRRREVRAAARAFTL